jgi:quinol monooxygenase YgiN
MFVVIVHFDIKPDKVAAFREAMVGQAKRCLELEAGCRQFDVSQDPAVPTSFFLYEVYENEAAFEEHRSSAHFHAFGPRVKDMIVTRKLLTYHRVSGPTAKA